MHLGLMDLFPLYTGCGGTGSGAPPPAGSPNIFSTSGLVMGYYDGNTVTALWNYAQRFAMSDNSYNTTFGPSTPGALNLISGQTNGVIATLNGTGDETDGGNGSLTMISDADPIGDVCSTATGAQGTMGGSNIGDLLTAANITWGFFSGGFDLTDHQRRRLDRLHAHDDVRGHQRRRSSTTSRITSRSSTTRRRRIRRTRGPHPIAAIGSNDDGANHQYDIHDFFDALRNDNLPAVSFLKAPGYQDGHAGYSDPLDEQAFIVKVVNIVQFSPFWKDTAIVIAYDDSDGWYDHQMPPIVNQSASPGRCADRRGRLRRRHQRAARHRCGERARAGTLRLRSAPAAARDLAVGQAELRRPHPDRSDLDPALRRRQLARAARASAAVRSTRSPGSIEGMFDFSDSPVLDKLRLDAASGQPVP